MPFDQPTRNRLARFVADARSLLSEEFTRQLQHEYGLDPGSGDVAELAKLGHLDDARRETARILRATLAHYLAGAPKADKKARQETLQRIVREQAYTVLNRLAALRMAEARGLLIESVGRGYQSRGFQLYAHLAGPALGETGAAYRSFLFSLFDELAVELPALFDRFSPQGRLFPREASLLRLLDLLNVPDLEALWGEDETLGWIYQYFNSSEERRQMRAESQAPRNSRELAVRNQFFTPRYVVEFLTDNTLGRIWYEMTQGRTALAQTCRYLVRRPVEVFLAEGEEALEVRGSEIRGSEGGEEALSQEELLRQPVYIRFRPLKDPRDIKMLDSACGSMHFGLYSFDLYEIIYAEAWDLEGTPGASAFLRSKGLKPLRETYADKDALRRDVPRLIMEHNIHGIDIDPRAVQIAGLSLWLRAQRSWQAQGVKPQDRPRIQRSNIVCAEPMPGDKALLEEFLAGLRADRLEGLIRRVLHVPTTQQVRATERMADALCDLVRVVWDEMTLAGEAGSLLKIEQTLANAVRAAEAEWSERMPLFRVVEFGLTGEAERVRYPRTIAGQEEGADFWAQAEALVLAALQDYAEQAQNGAGYQRRLFVKDAERGFAFIDLCRNQYDVVLINPPFGSPSLPTESFLRRDWGSHANDIYILFALRALMRLAPTGRLGIISSRNFLLGRDQRDFRLILLGKGRGTLKLLVDLGLKVLDGAEVETCTYIIEQSEATTALFYDFRSVDRSHLERLEDLLRSTTPFTRELIRFLTLPATPIMYGADDSVLSSYSSDSCLDPDFGRVTKGLTSLNDERFILLFWEVDSSDITKRWRFCAKGADYLWFVSNIHTVVDWHHEGEYVAAFVATVSDNVAQAKRSSTYYFLPGATCTYRCSDFSLRALPAGCAFTNAAPVIIPDREQELPALFAAFFSKEYSELLSHISKKGKYDIGRLKQVPAPPLIETNQALPSWENLTNYLLRFESYLETSPYFVVPANDGCSFSETEYSNLVLEFMQAYGYDASDVSLAFLNASRRLLSQRYEAVKDISHNWLSYGMGAAFGRWDVRFAMGTRELPCLPNPFDPLPPVQLGALQDDEARTLYPKAKLGTYPFHTVVSEPILVDDEGSSRDIVEVARQILEQVWKDRASEIEETASTQYGLPSLRACFRDTNAFFASHLATYSKSFRSAPVYWPLSTLSGSYTLWLYYHRLSDQILYSCVNDFVEPKLAEVRDQRSELQRRSGRSAREERELERLGDLETELREFRDELLRVAAFWRPNLNDGVQITAAPLWRLFRHRAWQRRLRETWEQLEAGDYDWAHLALSIWPARVVPKCVTDRSLAIAHDLEELFWVEDPPSSWRNLRAPDEEIAGLVAAQRSPARERLAVLLAELARGRARGLRCAEVWDELAAGRWDDLEAALLLWPERVAEQCWDDPLLAVTLQITLPTKRTKAARERFIKERVAAGCADLAAALEAALRERPDRFAAFWSELARGDHDHLRLALALWPARVVAQCAADVELAAGHDVRRFLWVRGGVWRRRMGQEREVADEVERRQGK